jgi:hypothetical protein
MVKNNHDQILDRILFLRIRTKIPKENYDQMTNYIKLCKDCVTCSLCMSVELIKDGKLLPKTVVDHFHSKNNKGSIRGLLCHSCNIKEGKIRKKIEIENITFSELIKRYGENFINNLNKLYVHGGILPMQLD